MAKEEQNNMSKSVRAAATLLTLGMGMMAAQELRIAKAMYGHDTRWIDVTETLRRAKMGERLDIVVSNQFFGMDPAPAQVKTLRLEYFINGQPMREDIPENTRLMLPRGMEPGYREREGPRLRIISAQYGAGDRVMDVTGVLQSRVREGMLITRVNPEALGTDPVRGRPKVLRVEYEYMGRRYRTEAPDFAEMRLPEPAAMQGGPEPMPPPPPPPGGGEMRGELRIINAGYGARDRFSDVTRILRDRRGPDGGIHMKVNNTNLGGDPYLGADKILRIDYEFEGRRLHKELREGDQLNLP
jgi:hypothetical protein